MTGDNWFKPKTYGFGAQLSSWQGWVSTGAFVLACVVWAVLIVSGDTQSASDWVVFAAGLVALIAGFTLLAKMKTEGTWRWGKKTRSKER